MRLNPFQGQSGAKVTVVGKETWPLLFQSTLPSVGKEQCS